jgi:hypothetical protein
MGTTITIYWDGEDGNRFFTSCHRIIIEVRYEEKDMAAYHCFVDHGM